MKSKYKWIMLAVIAVLIVAVVFEYTKVSNSGEEVTVTPAKEIK